MWGKHKLSNGNLRVWAGHFLSARNFCRSLSLSFESTRELPESPTVLSYLEWFAHDCMLLLLTIGSLVFSLLLLARPIEAAKEFDECIVLGDPCNSESEASLGAVCSDPHTSIPGELVVGVSE